MRMAFCGLFAVAFVTVIGPVVNAEDIETLRKERDALLQRVVELSDQMNELQNKNAKLQESNESLQRQLVKVAFRKIEQQSKALPRQDEFDLWLVTPIEGVVTSTKDRLIEISIGLEDGVREGMVLEIFRNTEVVGTATIRKVTPDRSLAEVSETVRKSVRKGDRIHWDAEGRGDMDWPYGKNGFPKRERQLEERRKQLFP